MGAEVASPMRLEALYLHPVKSARGVRVTTAEVEPRGLRYDRRWMIVNTDGRFLSQRQDPRLGRIVPRLEVDRLRLRRDGAADLELPLGDPGGARRTVTVWNDSVEAADLGDEAAAWLDDLLGAGHRLVRMPEDAHRPVDPAYGRPGDEVSFADGYPFLLTNLASLEELNRRAGHTFEIERFRPNLVISGAEPFAEDGWDAVTVGEVRFRVAKSCLRCSITTLDPASGTRGREPLLTLATFRRQRGGVAFGQNLIADGTGRLQAGDAVVADSPDAATAAG